jgi:hypothetical protein
MGVCDGVAEFATFVDRAGSFGCNVAGNSAGKRKLLEQFADAVFGLRNLGIELAISAFEIGVRDERGTAMSGT